MNGYLGETAGLGASICWTFTSIFFTIAGRKVGSFVVNRVRLILAVVFLSTTHLLLLGRLVPTDAGLQRWLWLGLSGIIGLAVGDALYLQALIWIGPRLTTLLFTLSPIIGAGLGWLLLGEQLHSIEMVAIGLTVGSVALVIADRGVGATAQPRDRNYYLGILVAIGGAVGQAVGLIASKQGMAGNYDPLSATLIRMIVAAVALWILTFAQRQAGRTLRALDDKRASLAIVGGAIAGPFIGVWLSLVAVKLARVGIAATLMSLAPVFVLLPSHFIFGERINTRSLIGTIGALAGVVMLILL